MNIDKRQAIFAQAMEAKLILDTLKTGQNVMDTDEDELPVIEKRIRQMLHLRQYAKMYEFAFSEWSTDDPEQTYLQVGDEAKILHEIVNHDVFKETLMGLFMFHNELTGKETDSTYEGFMEGLKKECAEAGLIQGETQVSP